jgi:transcriptional regulator with XRE-family HTH domain
MICPSVSVPLASLRPPKPSPAGPSPRRALRFQQSVGIGLTNCGGDDIEEPKKIDANIGGRIRERRLLLGLSGRQLAEMIGVSTQQVHKYETATDRVSAGLLYLFAQALETPVTYFFEGLGGQQIPVSQRQRLLMEFVHNFREIQNKKHQQAIGDVIRLLVGRPAGA